MHGFESRNSDRVINDVALAFVTEHWLREKVIYSPAEVRNVV